MRELKREKAEELRRRKLGFHHGSDHEDVVSGNDDDDDDEDDDDDDADGADDDDDDEGTEGTAGGCPVRFIPP